MKPRNIFIGLWILVLLGWAGYFAVGTKVAYLLAGRIGGIVLRVTKGKVAAIAVPVFVHNRMAETLWLATLALIFVTAHFLFEKWRRGKNIFARSGWAIHGVVGFIFLNLWVGAAANTALYWGVLGVGAGWQNLMQFQLKRILMAEYPGRHRAVLVGNSQSRAQIDEDQLNDIIGSRLWTTELHYPGSQAFDLLLAERQFRAADPELVFCYVTTGYFYQGTKGEAVPPFFSVRDIPDFVRRGAFHELPDDRICYGVLGGVMPLFRSRDVLAQRFLGDTTVNLKQAEYNAALASDLQARAKTAGAGFQIDHSTDFQKRAFEDFISRCETAHRRVVLFAGQYNPLLESIADPAVHADMLAFLAQLKSRHANVIVVSPAEMPVETAADYDDLSHVNEAAQKRFTDWLAGWLEKQQLLEEPPSSAKK
jgi:hypothetical protein